MAAVSALNVPSVSNDIVALYGMLLKCNFLRVKSQVVLESLYPGCPFEREVLGLEILQLVLSELLPSEGKGRRQAEEPRLAEVVCFIMQLEQMIVIIANCDLSPMTERIIDPSAQTPTQAHHTFS